MRISYTFLSTYKRCRRRALLQYVQKVVPYEKMDNRPFIVGICADWLFKKWVESGYPKNWMDNKAEEIFEWFATKKKIRYISSDDKGKLLRKLSVSVIDLQEAAFVERLPERRLDLQLEVEYPVQSHVLTGKMDIWFPDEKAIYDLKITSSTKYLDSFQLRYFAWLVESKMGIPVSRLAFLSPLMSPFIREVSWSPEDKTELELEVMGLLSLISEEKWEATAKDCWGCPVTNFCEGGEETVVESKRSVSGGFSLNVGGSGGSGIDK